MLSTSSKEKDIDAENHDICLHLSMSNPSSCVHIHCCFIS